MCGVSCGTCTHPGLCLHFLFCCHVLNYSGCFWATACLAAVCSPQGSTARRFWGGKSIKTWRPTLPSPSFFLFWELQRESFTHRHALRQSRLRITSASFTQSQQGCGRVYACFRTEPPWKNQKIMFCFSDSLLCSRYLVLALLIHTLCPSPSQLLQNYHQWSLVGLGRVIFDSYIGACW